MPERSSTKGRGAKVNTIGATASKLFRRLGKNPRETTEEAEKTVAKEPEVDRQSQANGEGKYHKNMDTECCHAPISCLIVT